MHAHWIQAGLVSLALAAITSTAVAQELPVLNRTQLLPYPTGVAPHPSGEKYGFGCGLALEGNRMFRGSPWRTHEPAPPISQHVGCLPTSSTSTARTATTATATRSTTRAGCRYTCRNARHSASP
jgi:hypothetical protein